MTKVTQFIPLTSNTMFKELFGKNKRYVSLLLSWQLELDYKYVYKNIQYIDKYLGIDKSIKDYKFETDVIVVLDDTFYNIEMNNGYWPGLENRNLAYLNRIFTSQFNKGDDKEVFNKAKKVIQINYNSYNEPKDKNNGESVMYDLINEVVTSDRESQININLAKVKEKSYNKVTKKLTGIEKIARVLLSENRKDVDFEMNEETEKLLEKIEELSSKVKIIGAYNKEKEEAMIKRSIASQAMEDGISKGIRQGISQGISQGINQGITKTVKNMLKKNLDIDTISEVSGMSKNDILKLKTS